MLAIAAISGKVSRIAGILSVQAVGVDALLPRQYERRVVLD
ncbi:MAG: hypothetical protein AAGF94_02375 [Pseudomonadota bacterium]